ncbi:hypothetical protein D5086_019825 [Populus alba]|uniref:Uncharacterized protein n=1 Tax=Populus alba TaxID=43335 RepID=A0ACC4BIY8_POPAL
MHLLRLVEMALKAITRTPTCRTKHLFHDQTLLEAIKHKYELQFHTSQIPEFQVFFNDQPINDFNTLFDNLPQERQYFAAGVLGSFYGMVVIVSQGIPNGMLYSELQNGFMFECMSLSFIDMVKEANNFHYREWYLKLKIKNVATPASLHVAP